MRYVDAISSQLPAQIVLSFWRASGGRTRENIDAPSISSITNSDTMHLQSVVDSLFESEMHVLVEQLLNGQDADYLGRV